MAALWLLAGLAGCGGGRTPQPFRKGWTVLVYMAADNDLAPDALLNINQMERVGSTAGLNIVVELDLPAGFGGGADTRRLLILRDDDPNRITSPVLQDLGDVDTGRPAALRDFLAWGASNFPADHTAVVLWNHGSGWRAPGAKAASGTARQEPKRVAGVSWQFRGATVGPRLRGRAPKELPTYSHDPLSPPEGASLAAQRGVLFDDTSGTFMTTPDVDAGLAVPGVRWDLVAFDASLMQMLEVAHEIRGRTGLVAGSEESPPGTGYPYDRILATPAANPGLSPVEFGQVFVREHVAAYPTLAVTQSLVRTDRLADLAQRVSNLGTALTAALPAQAATIGQARLATQAYAIPYYRDLFDFARQVLDTVPDPAAQQAAVAVLQAFPPFGEGPVVAEAHNLPAVARSHGLAIYLPGPNQFFAGYDALQISRDFPGWLAFSQAIGGAPTHTVPTPGVAHAER